MARSRPGYTARPVPAGSITFLFSDIEGSTTINERLGDARWVELLTAHNAVFEREVRGHGGRIIKTMGDGYMVAFTSPHGGVRCGLSIQRALLSPESRLPGEALRVRIGLHSGMAIRQGGDFLGREVNYAARIASVARGGEVLVSGAVHQCLCDAFQFADHREVELRGFEGLHPVYPATEAR